jgi:hypothetical protein
MEASSARCDPANAYVKEFRRCPYHPIAVINVRLSPTWNAGRCISACQLRLSNVWQLVALSLPSTSRQQKASLSRFVAAILLIAGPGKSFRQVLPPTGNTYSLSKDGPALAELYQDWLLSQHTPRYQGITSPAHRAWLKQVVILAVVRFLTWQKYERYSSGEREALADPWVANQLHQLHLLREVTKDLPRLVHHILDNPEHGQQLIEQFCTTLDKQVQEHTLVLPEALPELPDGVSHPFLLLSAGKGEENA